MFSNFSNTKQPEFAKDEIDQHGEDGDGQYEVNENYYGAQHVIALVDCHPDMFQKGKNDDHEPTDGIELSIKLVQTLLQQTIEQTVIRKTGKRNGVGLLLYNTKTKQDSNDGKDSGGNSGDSTDDDDDDKMDDEDDDDEEMDDESTVDENKSTTQQIETTVHRLLDLKPPGIRHAQTLRKIVLDKRKQRQKPDDTNLKANFCPSADDPDPTIAPLQIALEESTRMFLNAKCVRDPSKNRSGKNEYDTKSIWIFTNQSNPYSDEKNQMIHNIAAEAKEQRIRIIVWPLAKPSESENNQEFVSPFFESIASEVLFEHRLRSLVELEDGMEEIYRTMAKKRRMYYGSMHILHPGMNLGNCRSIEDPAIMIDWYSVVQLSRKPGRVAIDTASKK